MADIYGFLEEVADEQVLGWVINREDPSERPVVTILLDGDVVGEVVADGLRDDLLEAGFGDGRYAFRMPLPADLTVGRHLAEAHVGGTPLKQSPLLFEWLAAARSAGPGIGGDSSDFVNSIQALRVFSLLLDLEAAKVTKFALEGINGAAPDAADQMLDMERYASLHSHFAGSAVKIEDLWFTSDNTLRLRVALPAFDPGLQSPVILHFIQRDEIVPERLLSLAQHRLAAGELAFLDVSLCNPYMPLLVTARTVGGRLLGITLLPFPSLCRGGAHFGELLAIADQPDLLASLRSVSDMLVRERVEWEASAPDCMLGRIEVALHGATGAERIFSPPSLAWLAGVGRLRVLAADIPATMDPELQAHLNAELQRSSSEREAPREGKGTAVLRLPADAIPTLSAVFSRRLQAPSGSPAIRTSYVVAEASTGRPVWSVSLPPVTEELLALQPRGCPVGFPQLLCAAVTAASDGAGRAQWNLPLAIRFMPAASDNEAALLRPAAPDQPAPLLRTELAAAERETAVISLLLPSHLGTEAAALLLGSLALQTLAKQVNIIAATRPGDQLRTEVLEEELERLFPGRYQTLDIGGLSPAGEINAIAALAAGPYLLIPNEPIILHDPRTLETLVTMMRGRTASASCVLLRERVSRKGTAVTFHSGGFYPSHVSFLSAPTLIFSEPNSHSALPDATFRVFGNPFRLVLLRATAWAELGGLDAGNFPVEQYDLDFAMRSLRAGYHHLCTSAVTATSSAAETGRDHLDPLARHFLPYGTWEDMLVSSTALRDLS